MPPGSKNKKLKHQPSTIRVLSAQASASGSGARPVASVEFRRQNRRVHTVMTAGRSSGDVVVEGRELLTSLNVPLAGVTAGSFFPLSVIGLSFHRNASTSTFPPTLSALNINPDGPPTTLRLAALAKYWEKYRVIDAHIEFVSSASRNAAGAIAIGVNPDAYDYIATGTAASPVAVVSQQQWCSRQGTTETYVGDDVTMRVPVDQAEHYYVEANRSSGVDDASQLRLASFGTLGVMALNNLVGAQPIGSLYLRYKIELMVPRMPQEFADSPSNESLQMAMKANQPTTVALDPGLGAYQVVEPDGVLPTWWDNTSKTIITAGQYLYDLSTIFTSYITDAMLNNTSLYNSGLGSNFTPVSGGPTTYNFTNKGFQILALVTHAVGDYIKGYLNSSVGGAGTAYQTGGPFAVTNATAYLLARAVQTRPVEIVDFEDLGNARLVRNWAARWPQYADQACRVLMACDGIIEPVGVDIPTFIEAVTADAQAGSAQDEPMALQFLPLESFDHLVDTWSELPAGPAKARWFRSRDGRVLLAGVKSHRSAEIAEYADRVGGSRGTAWRAVRVDLAAAAAPPRELGSHAGIRPTLGDDSERNSPLVAAQVGIWRQGVAGQFPGNLPVRLPH